MGTGKDLTIDKVRAALEQANGSVSEAARLLGVSRRTIYDWMRKGHLVRVITLIRKPADPFRADVLRGDRSKLDGDVS